MSLSTTTSKIQYTGNGSTTVFAYPFLILDQSHIRITETETTTNVDTVKTLTTHYTVSGVGSSGGGNITATSAPSSTKIWTIERVVPLTQLLALSAASSIPVVELEKALDKLMMAIQQLGTTGSVTDRSIRYKATEPSGFTAEIPLVSDRAGKVLYFATTTGTLTVADANTLFSSQIASITASTATATAAASAASASAADAADSAAAASAAAAASSAIPLWSTGAAYTLGAIVRYTDEKIYRCATAHTSGTFATDLAAAKWVELSPTVNDTLKKTITQASHGFAAGDVLKFASGAWAKAQADSAANSEAEGVVESSVDTNNFVIVLAGYCTLSGLTQNTEYYLSPSTAGLLTGTVPSTAGQIIRRIGKAISTTVLIINIQQPGVQVV